METGSTRWQVCSMSPNLDSTLPYLTCNHPSHRHWMCQNVATPAFIGWPNLPYPIIIPAPESLFCFAMCIVDILTISQVGNDRHAICVKRGGKIVDHVPREQMQIGLVLSEKWRSSSLWGDWKKVWIWTWGTLYLQNIWEQRCWWWNCRTSCLNWYFSMPGQSTSQEYVPLTYTHLTHQK